jgi:hypothetical protein
MAGYYQGESLAPPPLRCSAHCMLDTNLYVCMDDTLDPKRDPSLNKTILLAGVNNGYKDFMHNFKCYTDRLGIKFLPGMSRLVVIIDMVHIPLNIVCLEYDLCRICADRFWRQGVSFLCL